MLLQYGAQGSGGTGTAFAMAFCSFLLELGQRSLNGFLRCGTHCRIELRPGGLGQRGLRWDGFTACGTQFIGPYRHWRQRRCSVRGRSLRLHQRTMKSIGHDEQLRFRRIELRRKARVEAVPVAICSNGVSLLLPVGDVAAKAFFSRLRVVPRLGRQDFEALRQQHRGFSVHLRAMLQVFNALYPLRQLALEARQRFARQRRAGFGRVALPGQCVGDVELGLPEQCLRLLCPLGTDRFLAFGTFELVELFAQQAGGTLVASAQLLEYLLHLFGRRIAREPITDAARSLARSRRRECAAGEVVEGLEVVGLGRG